MNDLREVTHFEKAILKIDIEGDEDQAILHSSKLFQDVYIPYVLMEWAIMKKSTYGQADEVVNYMYTLAYQAHSIEKEPLDNKQWRAWPDDIVWKHHNVDL